MVVRLDTPTDDEEDSNDIGGVAAAATAAAGGGGPRLAMDPDGMQAISLRPTRKEEEEASRFQVLVQLQIVGRENIMRTDLLTGQAMDAITKVLGKVTLVPALQKGKEAILHNLRGGTLTFMIKCVNETVAACWCDPAQWAIVSTVLRPYLLRLAFARPVKSSVKTAYEAMKMNPDVL